MSDFVINLDGPNWLNPVNRVDRDAIRAKHRALALPRAKPAVSPETMAKLHKAAAISKKRETTRRVRVWNSAIAIIDQSELAVRDVIERGLADYAGLDHLRIGDAMNAVNRVMKQVAAIRTKAIKKAFRFLRDKGV